MLLEEEQSICGGVFLFKNFWIHPTSETKPTWSIPAFLEHGMRNSPPYSLCCLLSWQPLYNCHKFTEHHCNYWKLFRNLLSQQLQIQFQSKLLGLAHVLLCFSLHIFQILLVMPPNIFFNNSGVSIIPVLCSFVCCFKVLCPLQFLPYKGSKKASLVKNAPTAS